MIAKTGRLTRCSAALLAVLLFCCFIPRATAQQSAKELTVAAAADLTNAAPEIATGFEKQTGSHVRLVFGSSGNLTVQIQNGAPFDVFLSADTGYPKKLVEDGLADPSSMVTYAVGRLAVLTPADSKLDFERGGLAVLLDPAVQKVAIANPVHAPYGRAAQALLVNAGLYSKLKSKIVFGENVAQTAQFVESGNAQAGIISGSLAVTASKSGRFRYWNPPALYPPIAQSGVILKRTSNSELARSFLNYLRGERARQILARYGFEFPDSANTGHKP